MQYDELGDSAFWAAVAGVAPVLGLTLVLELRYWAPRWRGGKHWSRWLHGGLHAIAGISCIAALNAALLRLWEPDIVSLTPFAVVVMLSLAGGVSPSARPC